MKISNVEVYGLEHSIRASKFPFAIDTNQCSTNITPTARKLAHCDKGTGHDNFLNGIVVQFDLTFPLKAWTEMQRYHFIDFVSSQSTMHCITKFEIKKQCNQYVSEKIIHVLEELKADYLSDSSEENFRKLIYNIPSGFELTARMTTNYRQLKTIYTQRKNHRLPDWKEFCAWIETLPESDLITG